MELLPVLGQLGGGGVLLGVIVYLLAHIRADRAAASERIDAANRRADEAEARARDSRQREEAAWRRAIDAETTLSQQLQLPPAPPTVDPTAPPALPVGGDQ